MQHFFDEAISSTVNVGTSDTLVLAKNSGRRFVEITSCCYAPVYISMGATAEMNKGGIIPPGGTFRIEEETPFKGEIRAICSIDTTLNILEA